MAHRHTFVYWSLNTGSMRSQYHTCLKQISNRTTQVHNYLLKNSSTLRDLNCSWSCIFTCIGYLCLLPWSPIQKCILFIWWDTMQLIYENSIKEAKVKKLSYKPWGGKFSGKKDSQDLESYPAKRKDPPMKIKKTRPFSADPKSSKPCSCSLFCTSHHVRNLQFNIWLVFPLILILQPSLTEEKLIKTETA